MTRPVAITVAALYADWTSSAHLNRGAGSISVYARDVSLKSRPLRHLWAEAKHDLWVWSAGTRARRPRLMARLDLRSPTAVAYLERMIVDKVEGRA